MSETQKIYRNGLAPESWDRDDVPFSGPEYTLADVACFLRSRRNVDGSITLTKAEASRLAGLLGHPL